MKSYVNISQAKEYPTLNLSHARVQYSVKMWQQVEKLFPQCGCLARSALVLLGRGTLLTFAPTSSTLSKHCCCRRSLHLQPQPEGEREREREMDGLTASCLVLLPYGWKKAI